MKRANKEDNMWDCSVCTYRNSPEAFKCLMCDVRKGTSTRKPRLNAELVAAQVAQVQPPKPKKSERMHRDRKIDGRTGFKGRPRLKNVDRSTAEHNAVTVNNVTVIITEFQPKQKTSSSSSMSHNSSHAAVGSGSSSSNNNTLNNGAGPTHNGVNGSLHSEGGGGVGHGSIGGVMSSSEAGSISDASEPPSSSLPSKMDTSPVPPKTDSRIPGVTASDKC